MAKKKNKEKKKTKKKKYQKQKVVRRWSISRVSSFLFSVDLAKWGEDLLDMPLTERTMKLAVKGRHVSSIALLLGRGVLLDRICSEAARMVIWRCCSGLGLSLSLVPGMRTHVRMLLRMVILMCCSGLGLSQSLVPGMRAHVHGLL